MTLEQPGLMARLRAATRELHDLAEGHPLQKALAGGVLPQGTYAELLGQLWCVHGVLESCLRRLAAADTDVAGVVGVERFKEALLHDDLRFLGFDAAEVEPVEATVALTDSIAATGLIRPRALLGYHYVLEGSTNGGKYIARAVQRAYGFPPGRGTRYFDPYGAEQSQRWYSFKRDMDSIDFSPQDADAIVESAGEMFRGITSISEALHRRRAAAVAVS